MLTTLLFDFSRVLAFPKTSGDTETVSQAYHNPTHTTDAFSAFLDLNQELIEFVRTHQEYPAHIFSASSLQMLEEVRGFLIPPFQSMISASHENLPKRSPESYKEVAFRLRVKPSEMLFVDDSPDVVQAAQAAGVTAIQYISNEDLFSKLRVILPIQM